MSLLKKKQSKAKKKKQQFLLHLLVSLRLIIGVGETNMEEKEVMFYLAHVVKASSVSPVHLFTLLQRGS